MRLVLEVGDEDGESLERLASDAERSVKDQAKYLLRRAIREELARLLERPEEAA